MKRYVTLCMIAFTALLFSSCEKEECWYLESSHWILHVDGMTEGHRLALTFNGNEMTVHDGSWDTPPFYSSDTWYYHIGEDSRLYMYKYEVDSDDDVSTTSYYLDFSMDEAETSITLTYNPWLGSRHTYKFDRR